MMKLWCLKILSR